MFALTFFGVLHVPINVPALGISTGEDNLNVDRELIAHGVTNALSGFAGSIQVRYQKFAILVLAVLTHIELPRLHKQPLVYRQRWQLAPSRHTPGHSYGRYPPCRTRHHRFHTYHGRRCSHFPIGYRADGGGAG